MGDRASRGCCYGCRFIDANLTDPQETWDSKVAFTDQEGSKTWRVIMPVSSNDFKMQATVNVDGNGSSVASHVPHEWTIALVDSATELDALTIHYTSINRVDIPPDFEHMPEAFLGLPKFLGLMDDIAEIGSLSIAGLGIDLDLRVARTTQPNYSIVLGLYDDTLIMSFNYPPHSLVFDGNLFDSQKDFVHVWSDDRTFHAGSAWYQPSSTTSNIFEQSTTRFREWLAHQQNYIAIQRDPEVAPRVNAEFRTPTEAVTVASLTYQETEKLTAVGQPRVPHDESQDETTTAKNCELPYEGCLLVGTEEDLRLEVEVDWGVYQETFPLAGAKCVSSGRAHLGSFPATEYDTRNNVPEAAKVYYEVKADALGELVHTVFEQTPQGAQSITAKLVTPFSMANHRAEFFNELDGDPADPIRSTVSIRCELFRNPAGNLALRTIAEFGFIHLASPTGVASLAIPRILAGGRANFTNPELENVVDVTEGGSGHSPDPCNGMPILDTQTIKPKPVIARTEEVPLAFKRQTLTWETDLGVAELSSLADFAEVTLPASTATGWDGDAYPSRTAQKVVGVTLGTVTQGTTVNVETALQCFSGGFGSQPFYGNGAEVRTGSDATVSFVTEDYDLNAMSLTIRPQGFVTAAP